MYGFRKPRPYFMKAIEEGLVSTTLQNYNFFVFLKVDILFTAGAFIKE
jgi:hypothetical protein